MTSQQQDQTRVVPARPGDDGVDERHVATEERARRWKRTLTTPEVGVAIVIVLLSIGIAALNPAFLNTTNLFNLLRAMSITGILAVGMTFVIVSGELDLSVGSVLAFSSLAAVMLLPAGPGLVTLVVAVLVGALTAAVSATIVTRLGVNSFIVTLGMLSVARGLGLMLSEGLPQSTPPVIRWIGQARWGPVPAQVLILAVVVVIGQYVLRRTVFGEQVQAVGDNREAARLSGIPVARVKTACFLILGCLAGLAGMIRAGQLAVAEPNAAQGIELDVIAAVVIGGASLFGGRGSVIGAVLGATLLAVLRNAFVLLNLSNFLQVVSIGVVIILAVVFDRFRSGRTLA
ncbi:ABC transporter permease [Nitriliruptor alkaliphilus]|uniref:ABC transporter permease n=1 Tax=Nitriliruptor alkaliphilus TaxID=427918 RepID=UPI00069725BA|nr:ABC transporter permease [Nitriliruptor alkaliphilus]